MTDSPAREPRHALEAERAIPEFDTYELPDGRWRAVHKTDTDLTVEHSDWSELFMVATTVRIRREIQRASDELMERHLRTRGRGEGWKLRAGGTDG